MVQSPVGARCPECARLYKLPTYRVSKQYYLRAIGTALGMAIIGGVVWGVVIGFMPIFFFNFLLAPGVGYAIGEVVSLSVNRKRGRGLAILAGAAVVISYLVSVWSVIFFVWIPFHLGLPFGLFNIILILLALALGIFVAVTRLR
jgi:hypothetical protein